jgi:PhnB protein
MKQNFSFAPQLCIKSGVHDIEFYTKAFGAKELQRWTNDDGSIHVAELSIDGSLFHLHEESEKLLSPEKLNAVTTEIGVFVSDVDAVMQAAIAAGAEELSSAKSYDYGYRQGAIKDPFDHHWLIEAKI